MDTSDRIVLRRLILGLTLVILVGVVVWVFFVRDHGKKNTSSKSGTNTQQAAKSGQSSPESSSQQGANSQAQGNPAPSPGNNGAAGGQPTALANTGPGNLAVVFAGAAAAGGLGRHFYLRRRTRNV